MIQVEKQSKKKQAVIYFLQAVGILLVEQLILLPFMVGGSSLLKTLLACLVLPALTIAGIWIAKKVNLLAPKGSLRGGEVAKYLGLGFLATYLVKMIGGVLLFIQYGLEGNTLNQEVLDSLPLSPIVLFLITVFVAPVIEELVLRGYIMGKVFGEKSWLGLVVSSILFGLIHVPTDLGSWVIYGGMGLVLGVVYRMSGKLEYAIGLHFLNNLLGAIIMLLI